MARDNVRMAACAQCGAELPADARFCPSCAAPVERSSEPAEERKVATVLFADLVGSTALASEQDPERTRALLDRFYDAMAKEIEQAGGTVEKFVGDAVLAAFGAPAALEDHAERALHAALGMQRRLRELFGEGLGLRIGVNTGEVVVGRPREGSSFVTGDAVNVGARLEQAAGPGEILVGERTAAAVRGAFELAEPVTVEAKGKPEGVPAQRLVRALSLMRPRGVGGLRTVFVGRDAELGQLQESYRRCVAEGRPQLVVIVGDAGVGKTRLVRELWAWLAAQVDGPLLVLATARPELLERRPAWHRWALSLEALRESTAGELLDGLVGLELPPQLRAAIVDRAEGNPFFVEELLATLIDRGVLQMAGTERRGQRRARRAPGPPFRRGCAAGGSRSRVGRP